MGGLPPLARGFGEARGRGESRLALQLQAPPASAQVAWATPRVGWGGSLMLGHPSCFCRCCRYCRCSALRRRKGNTQKGASRAGRGAALRGLRLPSRRWRRGRPPSAVMSWPGGQRPRAARPQPAATWLSARRNEREVQQQSWHASLAGTLPRLAAGEMPGGQSMQAPQRSLGCPEMWPSHTHGFESNWMGARQNARLRASRARACLGLQCGAGGGAVTNRSKTAYPLPTPASCHLSSSHRSRRRRPTTATSGASRRRSPARAAR